MLMKLCQWQGDTTETTDLAAVRLGAHLKEMVLIQIIPAVVLGHTVTRR